MESTDHLMEKRMVAGPFFQTLLDTVESLGISRGLLASRIACPESALEKVKELVPQSLYLSVLSAGRALTQDQYFGLHLGEKVRPGTYAVLGHTLISCSTLGQALQQVLRFEGLVHDLGTSTIRVNADVAEFIWNHHYLGSAWERDLDESTFAGMVTFAHWLAGKPVPISSISFTHAAPANTAEHQRIFQTEILFSQSENKICFPVSLALWPVTKADTSLFPVLEKHAKHLLSQKQSQQGLVGEVKRVLLPRMARQETQIGLVAEDLNLSARTLQRKLKDLDTSFQKVLDGLRQEVASYYLEHSSLSIIEITFLLGFKEQSSFNHAFKDWTGYTPKNYRER